MGAAAHWPAPALTPRANAPERGSDLGRLNPDLGFGGAPEADAPREPVHRQHIRADQLGERAARRPHECLQLEAAVLGLHEAEGERGVLVALRLDVRDAPAIAADRDRGSDAVHT